MFINTLSKAASAAQIRDKQQAVAAISMYMPQPIDGENEENDLNADEKAVLEMNRQQQIQAEIANYAGVYQSYFANYDPLYASYFQEEYKRMSGASSNGTPQQNAAAAVQEAQSSYNSYYNGYLKSGYVPPPPKETPKPDTGKRSSHH